MNGSAVKLMKLGVDASSATKLVDAGLCTPKAIREATKTRLTEITGLTGSRVDALKALFDRGQ